MATPSESYATPTAQRRRGGQETFAALQASFMVRYPWIRDFTAEPRGLGWRIFLIASKKVVDDVGDGTAQLSEKGRSSPVALTPEELHRVLEWQGARDSYLKRWRERDHSMVSEEDLKLLRGKPDNAVIESMTPDAAAAVLKEQRGVKIPKPDGDTYDHLKEAEGARAAVIKGMDRIEERMKQVAQQQGQSSELYELLQAKLSDLSKVLDHYERTTGWPWPSSH